MTGDMLRASRNKLRPAPPPPPPPPPSKWEMFRNALAVIESDDESNDGTELKYVWDKACSRWLRAPVTTETMLPPKITSDGLIKSRMLLKPPPPPTTTRATSSAAYVGLFKHLGERGDEQRKRHQAAASSAAASGNQAGGWEWDDSEDIFATAPAPPPPAPSCPPQSLNADDLFAMQPPSSSLFSSPPATGLGDLVNLTTCTSCYALAEGLMESSCECKRVFCRDCAAEAAKRPCVFCEEELRPEANASAARIVSSLQPMLPRCPTCAALVHGMMLPSHISICTQHEPCPQGCGEAVRALDIEHHVAHDCPAVTMTCPYGCEYPRGEQGRHASAAAPVHLDRLHSHIETLEARLRSIEARPVPVRYPKDATACAGPCKEICDAMPLMLLAALATAVIACWIPSGFLNKVFITMLALAAVVVSNAGPWAARIPMRHVKLLVAGLLVVVWSSSYAVFIGIVGFAAIERMKSRCRRRVVV